MSEAVIPLRQPEPGDWLKDAILRERAQLLDERNALESQIAPLNQRIGRLDAALAALEPRQVQQKASKPGVTTDAILEIASANMGASISVAEVRAALEARGWRFKVPNQVHTTMLDMARRGKLTKVGRALYRASN